MNRRTGALFLALVLLAGAGWWALVRPPAGIVARRPQSDTIAARYVSDLADMQQSGATSDVRSPDGRYVVSDSLVDNTYHTLHVLDTRTRMLTRVVSIREADPGSGSSHEVAWSADSRALLIRGNGVLWRRRLPRHIEPQPLCMVYVPAEDALMSVVHCR